MTTRYQSLQKIIEYRLLTISGMLVCICNLIILIVVNTNRDLRYKMCLHSFMAFADLVISALFFFPFFDCPSLAKCKQIKKRDIIVSDRFFRSFQIFSNKIFYERSVTFAISHKRCHKI